MNRCQLSNLRGPLLLLLLCLLFVRNFVFLVLLTVWFAVMQPRRPLLTSSPDDLHIQYQKSSKMISDRHHTAPARMAHRIKGDAKRGERGEGGREA